MSKNIDPMVMKMRFIGLMVEEPQTIKPTAEKARIIEQMQAIAHSDHISNSRKEWIIDLIVNNHHIIDAVSKWYVARSHSRYASNHWLNSKKIYRIWIWWWKSHRPLIQWLKGYDDRSKWWMNLKLLNVHHWSHITLDNWSNRRYNVNPQYQGGKATHHLK